MEVFRRSLLAALAATAVFPAALWAARPRTRVCQQAIASPHSQWGRHLKHVMHDEKTGEVTWTLQNGATVTHGNEFMAPPRVTGEVPKGFPVHALGKLSSKIRLSCQRHGRILLAAMLLMWAAPAFAQHQYSPPNRPWSVYLDGFTYLHQVNPLTNAPDRTHQFHWHGVFKFSRYQAHEGYLELLQSEFPPPVGDESQHSLEISTGGVDVFRNYDENNQWDGTWSEFCGPKDQSGRNLPCRGSLFINIAGDVEYQNSFYLQTPYAIVFDGDPDAPCWGPGNTQTGNCWHSYDVWVDTDVNRSGYYYARWAIDNIFVTAQYNGDPDTGDNVFDFQDNGSFHQPCYFPVDGMYWRQFNDNIENLYDSGWDQTSPVAEVAEHFFASNMPVPFDPPGELANETFTWQDQQGIFRPSNLGPGAQYPYGYIVEIFNIGDYLWYPIGTAPQAWSVEGYGSTEPYNQGYIGGQLTNGGDDPF